VLKESVGAIEALEAAVKRSDFAKKRARYAAENAKAAAAEARPGRNGNGRAPRLSPALAADPGSLAPGAACAAASASRSSTTARASPGAAR
jgi:hypothetical protein